MNRVILAGRLARDSKVTDSGKATFLTVCTETGWDKEKKEPFVEFVPVTCFFGLSDKQQEIYAKGAMVLIDAQVQHREYNDNWETKIVVPFQSGLKLMAYAKKEKAAASASSEVLPF